MLSLTCKDVREILLIPDNCCPCCHEANQLFSKVCGKYEIQHCCGMWAYFDTLDQDTLHKDIEEALDMSVDD